MAEFATIARPYARAAFEFARDGNALPGWSQFLASAAAVAADERIASLIDDPSLSGERLVALIEGIVAASGVAVADGERNFLRLVVEGHRLDALSAIREQYEALRADAENTLEVEVKSALALTPEQKGRLTAALTKRFKRQIDLKETVDAALIGGAVVKAGDLVIDGSLRNRMEELRTQMTRD